MPGAAGFVGVLVVERGDDQRCDFLILGAVGFDFVFLAVADGEGIGPLPGDFVEDVSLFSLWVEGRGEAVLLAA